MKPPVQTFNKPYSKVPLLVEFPVEESLGGPFLVSSSKGFLWVENAFSTGMVRAAVRTAPPEFLYREAIDKILSLSLERGWGNVHIPTREGAQNAISHLRYYGFTEIEVIHGSGVDPDIFPPGTPTFEEVWVPEGLAIVLPQDKSFVGTLIGLGKERNALLFHNASRGIGLVTKVP